LVGIDGGPIGDFLDFYLGAFGREHELELERGDNLLKVHLVRPRGGDLGAEVTLEKLRPCNNHCVFCFVDQLPPGLRRELHFKDEDYRLSFLHGNYLTLTNLKPADEARIVSQHLSPLYISVHTTEERVRTRLLGRKPCEPVLAVLKRMGGAGIRFHVQIVVVPGYNDGPGLRSTLRDLARLGRTVLSVSVVPVGLTSHRRSLPRLAPVDRAAARAIVDHLARLNSKGRAGGGTGKVYASDEMIILARRAIPAAAYYDDFPQIENGVGLVRQLLDQLPHLRVPRSLRGRHLRLVTGHLARPFLEEVAAALGRRGLKIDVITVGNTLFGPSVTASGLLPGKAILAALTDLGGCDAVVLPPDVTNADRLTLDDVSISEMGRALRVPVVVARFRLVETLKEVAVLLEGS
jgi:putative radical SAM enzyme (TIGR03279 family)